MRAVSLAAAFLSIAAASLTMPSASAETSDMNGCQRDVSDHGAQPMKPAMASPYERSFLAERREGVQWLCAVVVLRRSLIVERLRLEAAWHDEVDAAGQSQRARIGVVKRKHVLQTRRDCRENALARGIRIEDWKAQAVSLQVRQQRAKEAEEHRAQAVEALTTALASANETNDRANALVGAAAPASETGDVEVTEAACRGAGAPPFRSQRLSVYQGGLGMSGVRSISNP